MEEELKINIRKLLKRQLALESYVDDNGDNIPLLNEAHLELGDFRKQRDSMEIEEQIKISNKIIEKYDKVLDMVGRDNFIFYDDEDINYIWKGN